MYCAKCDPLRSARRGSNRREVIVRSVASASTVNARVVLAGWPVVLAAATNLFVLVGVLV